METGKSGPEQFSDWMRRRGFSQADAARFLGFDKPYVSVLLSGKRSPGLDNAILIERRTGIAVEAWSSIAFDESGEPVTAGAHKPQVTND